MLFDDLPETAPPTGRRRRAASPRRSAAAAVTVDRVCEPVPAPSPAPPAALPPLFAAAPPPPDPFDPARLSLAEIRALVQSLPDAKLSHLLTEAARELKQRVTAGSDWDDDDTGGDGTGEDGRDADPNPLLLRAARQVVGELSGDDA